MAAWVRETTRSLWKIDRMWALTVCSEIRNSRPIRRFDIPLTIAVRTWISRSVNFGRESLGWAHGGSHAPTGGLAKT